MEATILFVDQIGGCAFLDADWNPTTQKWEPDMLSIKEHPEILGPEDLRLPSCWQSAPNGLYE